MGQLLLALAGPELESRPSLWEAEYEIQEYYCKVELE